MLAELWRRRLVYTVPKIIWIFRPGHGWKGEQRFMSKQARFLFWYSANFQGIFFHLQCLQEQNKSFYLFQKYAEPVMHVWNRCNGTYLVSGLDRYMYILFVSKSQTFTIAFAPAVTGTDFEEEIQIIFSTVCVRIIRVGFL